MSRFVSERLDPRHVLDRFSCGAAALDRWLIEDALHAQSMRTAQTYIWHGGDQHVVAYFSLAAHLVVRSDLPKKVSRGSPASIPGVLLARLALGASLQGEGPRRGVAMGRPHQSTRRV